MRGNTLLAPTLLLLLACGIAHAADDAALHKRSTDLQAAETRKDAEGAVAFWAPDSVVQMNGSPKIEGREAILAAYRQFFTMPGLKRIEGTPMHLDVSGDLAYETGVNHMVMATPGGDVDDVGKYLLVWKRIDGQWYVVALSATSDAPPPAPAASAAMPPKG
jgi:uncharacterized protein (TIGR02246 family)